MPNLFHKVPNGIPEPVGNALIWRYMSFERLKDLLEKSELYFARLDRFPDFQEASNSIATQAEIRNEMRNQGAGDGIANVLIGLNRIATTQSCYASCWALKDFESNLHWRAYGPGETFKVVVVSTVDRLKESICTQSANLYSGVVKYIDYASQTSPNNIVEKAFIKRREYDGESEFRVLDFRPENLPSGIIGNMPSVPKFQTFRVDLSNLVLKILVEPVSIRDQEEFGISGNLRGKQEYRDQVVSELTRRLELVSELAKRHIDKDFGAVEASSIL